jgi:membrane protein
MWVYYSAQLFFLGAEFTKVYTEKFGSQFAAKLQASPVGPPGVIVDPSTGLPVRQTNPKITVKVS